ncbi:hypothetical protein X798_07608 [Onchocerca flexuosa]|uniref:Uncharacterized protein n=1 Tax=Onchocerca flexuosa TaxID=387005 RepID=A0A238BIY2_9BILA|nr:hypothetical protein X798_07608 [Onchocerca flexuosa]
MKWELKAKEFPKENLNLTGFASQHNHPIGNKFNNHWGDAVTVSDTTSGTLFFINFHIRDVGHTMIIGPSGSGRLAMSIL